MPVRIPRGGANTTTPGGGNSSDATPSPLQLASEERLPLRLRGVKAAYGRALGTAGKLYLDKDASTVGGHLESAVLAWGHLTNAAEVFRDWRTK